ncbi:MAG: PQQ-dependent sugar dehydrogenase [Bacteroidota bacterium]
MTHASLRIASALCCVLTSYLRAQEYSLQSAFPSLPAFSSPVEMVHAGDGTNRLFVVEQRGVIYLFQNSPGASERKVFLDISDNVTSGGELGLLGLAFHPDFSTNGYFYVNYTGSPGGQLQSFVSRLQISPTNPDSARRVSELVLLSLNQPFTNHNGGCLRFGPDGYLYIGFGDGGSGNDPGNRAQNLTELLGKLLRIDVDGTTAGRNYAIPPTNSFSGNTQGYREEIYAFGFRNPWRFSFDRVTDRLWLGDVGQNAREEVNIVVSGGNYGWRLMEGFICTPGVNTACQDTAGLLRPVWDYTHSDGNASITGGYVYRGTSISGLVGKYVYGDFNSGRIWALAYDGASQPTNQLLIDSPYLLSSFGEGADGELYIVSYLDGRIYRLTDTTAGSSDPAGQPADFYLHQNYPNPFNPTTTILFSIPAGTYGHTSLRVYSALGQVVATLVNEELTAGNYEATWGADGFSSGVYFYRLVAGGFVETKKLLLLN